eukprot:TRINITY_DN22_c0_g1_i5.p4 TRINITY_DN22_c0_g1~~TRINITY_DN22_c0_g1_i5.p4  ORF type:complete len:65 (+),score=3.36 TRINITY_DN22_c0_g1_i5:155-349(+)
MASSLPSVALKLEKSRKLVTTGIIGASMVPLLRSSHKKFENHGCSLTLPAIPFTEPKRLEGFLF